MAITITKAILIFISFALFNLTDKQILNELD